IFLNDVLSALRAERSLADDLRDAALRMATSRGTPDAWKLWKHAWPLVDPDRKDQQTDVVLGLRLARAGVELAPEDDVLHRTLAWALFANGLHDQALAESEKALEFTGEDGKEEYQSYLDRLREDVSKARAPHR
ncbi:MAG: hypothetical protein V3T22_02745, partial [Planctomycetota bacterium]